MDPKPIKIKKMCKKHNVIYKEFNGYYDAFMSYYNHLKLMYKSYILSSSLLFLIKK